METSTPAPESPELAQRRATVGRARESWIKKLTDTSRNNNLLYFRELKAGTLSLSECDPELWLKFLGGAKVATPRMVGPDEKFAASKALTIARKARANLEEKGIQTLFATYGMASWPSDDEGRPPEAPILLIPAEIRVEGANSDSVFLARTGPAQVNFALLHALNLEFGLDLGSQDLLPVDADEENEPLDEALAALAQKCRDAHGFSVNKKAILGNFSFQKLAMVKELQERGDELSENVMVAALAGDTESKIAIADSTSDPLAHTPLDAIPASAEFNIIDADASQQRVIHAVIAGQDVVIQGPPGCGKSQTIANTIASLVAGGQRVLFVAEKRAALEAVAKRLNQVGLGHLLLDLHGASVSQRTVMKRVSEALENIKRAPEAGEEQLHADFEAHRRKLAVHDRLMHSKVLASEETPFTLQAGLMQTAAHASQVRWRGPDLQRLDANVKSAVCRDLQDAGASPSLFLRTDPSPWTNAQIVSGTEAQAASDLARSLAQVLLLAQAKELDALATAAECAVPTHFAAACALLDALDRFNATLATYDRSVFELPLTDMAQRLKPGLEGGPKGVFYRLTNRGFKDTVRQLNGIRKAGTAEAGVLVREVEAATSVLADLGGRLPAAEVATRSARTAVEAAQGATRALDAYLHAGLESAPLADLPDKASQLAGDDTVYAIPSVRTLEANLSTAGVDPLVNEIRQTGVPPSTWSLRFLNAWYASLFDAVRAQAPEIAAFQGSAHTQIAQEFRTLDRRRLEVAASRVRRAHAERAVQEMNDHPDQHLQIKAETQRKRSLMPLRDLLQKAPEVLTAVCPCWMSSPLNVSQLLPADRAYFDVVIFDEASQVLPEDAVCSILRGRSLVVAGDQNQLPPTVFFADGGSEEEDDDSPESSGFESILNQVSAFGRICNLEWHYRSKNERLIAFSNRFIYDDVLTTFPGIGGAPSCIEHHLIESVPRDGEELSSTDEVNKVVGLILDHAERRPQETLGVIAMGIKHAMRLQAALDADLAMRPDLQPFFDPNKEQRFFIKNLEQVQGDERDAIILSVGYGKDRNGRLPYRFGPLLQEGGERRLNVAVTRAVRRMIVVSSFAHTDMDPNRTKARGVDLLRRFLQFAASEGSNLGDRGLTEAAPNAFESDIQEALTARGIPLIPQYGVSNYRLDFAAQHPTEPGRFVLAIEADGATYHSAQSARDRDRLRQQQLEAIGWRFHRIWSTDWFVRRGEEIERAVKAYEEAVRLSDAGRTSEPVLSSAATPIPPPILRGPRPDIWQRASIDDYPMQELVALAHWIQSDGLLRTDEEVIEEMLKELGKRRGAKILRALGEAVDRANASPPRP